MTGSDKVITESFFIRCEGRYVRIRVSDIVYIGACGNYVEIVTANQRYKTLYSLNKLEEVLPPKDFCRIHRSYIVAVHAITGFEYEKVYLGELVFSLKDHYRRDLFRKVNLINPVYRKHSAKLFT